MKTILIACLALVASCAPKAIVVRPISEQAAVVVGSVKAVEDHTKKVERTSSEIGKNVQDLAAQVAAAEAKASKMAREKQVTQAQLEDNARAWIAAKKLADDMTRTADNLRIDVSDLSKAVNEAKAQAETMRKRAHESDAAVRKLEKHIADMTPDYEIGKTLRHAFWFIVIGLILAVFLIIGFYFFTKAGRAAASVATHGMIPP